MRRPVAAAVAALALTASVLALRPAGAQTGRATGGTADGESLFLEGCASCHGADGMGVSGRGPTLEEAGEALAYYMLSTGRMPLANSNEVPVRKDPAYTAEQIAVLTEYVASLGTGPALPTDVAGGDIATGGEIYRANCAPCHTAAGIGGALSYGRAAPSLRPSEPTQIAAAVRSGPGQMPQFGPDVLDDAEVRDVIAYVRHLATEEDAGGLSLGGAGPVPEGFVVWVFGIGATLALCFWIGKKGHPS